MRLHGSWLPHPDTGLSPQPTQLSRPTTHPPTPPTNQFRPARAPQAAKQARSGAQPVQHGRIAVKCMATLLTALPHFNYTSDLLQALVPHMADRDPQTR